MDGEIHSSYATGNVSSYFSAAGGLVGINSNNGEIHSSYATGNVSSTADLARAGGLVGD